MELRLVEQACGCSTVQGGGKLRCVLDGRVWHSGGECLPLRNQAPAGVSGICEGDS